MNSKAIFGLMLISLLAGNIQAEDSIQPSFDSAPEATAQPSFWQNLKNLGTTLKTRETQFQEKTTRLISQHPRAIYNTCAIIAGGFAAYQGYKAACAVCQKVRNRYHQIKHWWNGTTDEDLKPDSDNEEAPGRRDIGTGTRFDGKFDANITRAESEPNLNLVQHWVDKYSDADKEGSERDDDNLSDKSSQADPDSDADKEGNESDDDNNEDSN